jgi:hypothetical protein
MGVVLCGSRLRKVFERAILRRQLERRAALRCVFPTIHIFFLLLTSGTTHF